MYSQFTCTLHSSNVYSSTIVPNFFFHKYSIIYQTKFINIPDISVSLENKQDKRMQQNKKMGNDFVDSNEYLDYRQENELNKKKYISYYVKPSLQRIIYSANQNHILTISLQLQLKFCEKIFFPLKRYTFLFYIDCFMLFFLCFSKKEKPVSDFIFFFITL